MAFQELSHDQRSPQAEGYDGSLPSASRLWPPCTNRGARSFQPEGFKAMRAKFSQPDHRVRSPAGGSRLHQRHRDLLVRLQQLGERGQDPLRRWWPRSRSGWSGMKAGAAITISDDKAKKVEGASSVAKPETVCQRGDRAAAHHGGGRVLRIPLAHHGGRPLPSDGRGGRPLSVDGGEAAPAGCLGALPLPRGPGTDDHLHGPCTTCCPQRRAGVPAGHRPAPVAAGRRPTTCWARKASRGRARRRPIAPPSSAPSTTTPRPIPMVSPSSGPTG